MNVNNNLQGLQQLFSSQEATRISGKASGTDAQTEQVGGDKTTLSAAASVAAAAAPDSDVRMDKVTVSSRTASANVPSTTRIGEPGK